MLSCKNQATRRPNGLSPTQGRPDSFRGAACAHPTAPGGDPPRPHNQLGQSTPHRQPRRAFQVWCPPRIISPLSSPSLYTHVWRQGHQRAGGRTEKKKKNSELQLHFAFKTSSSTSAEAILSLRCAQYVWVIQFPVLGVPEETFAHLENGRGASQGPGPPCFSQDAVQQDRPWAFPSGTRPSAGKEDAISRPSLLVNVLGRTEPFASHCLTRELARSHNI